MSTRLISQAKAVSVAAMVPARSGVLQRKCHCGGAPGPTGECVACQHKQQLGGALQTKLRVSQPGDRYEREADRVAEQVMRMPEPHLQRQIGPEKDEDLLQTSPLMQRQDTGESDVSEALPVVYDVLRSPGRPLEPSTRRFMETRFGHNFGQVRVHAGTSPAQSARSVNARAYTVGRNVVFGAGQYAPGTASGQRLLAHELTHVVQQTGGGAVGPAQGLGATVQLKPSAPALQRAAGDIVAYGGGPSSSLMVIQGGKLLFSALAISGHPGSKEFEKDAGPIPTGNYAMHPQKTQRTVTGLQSGICGANAISSGYQEITSNDPSPCEDPPSHYCTAGCPTAASPGRKCFTPKDCWGEKRLKIEGAVNVPKPTGGVVRRNGFYIHGGNHSVAVTSGCIKVFDNVTFTQIRKLKGKVPLCVGSACPPSVGSAAGKALMEAGGAIGGAIGGSLEAIREAVPD